MNKNFDNFTSQLTPAKVSELVEKANLIAVDIANTVPEQKQETLIAATAFNMSLELLREYHEWLNQ
ncbi:hypothetical protein Javan139_0049 [Streptococcus phage Javan139]|nr:hypothetical protein Javan139_0049 [Streptococcus phage Javan139]SQB67337.1 Uncharacterised protein [Streptococcus dysgalactiae]